MPKKVYQCAHCAEPFNRKETCRTHERWCPRDEHDLQVKILKAFRKGTPVFFLCPHDHRLTEDGLRPARAYLSQNLVTGMVDFGRVASVASWFNDTSGEVNFEIATAVVSGTVEEAGTIYFSLNFRYLNFNRLRGAMATLHDGLVFFGGSGGFVITVKKEEKAQMSKMAAALAAALK
jgi:hypothetical protein